MEAEAVLFDFGRPAAGEAWEIVNDVVMGGRSRSTFSVAPGAGAVFEGRVSLDAGGGFASVRTRPGTYRLGGFLGLSLRVKGDGRRYRLRLRTDDRFDGVAYQSEFDTRPGLWIDVALPFRDFKAAFRGRAVSGAAALDPDAVRRIGFMIADRREGPFRLEISWLKAYGPR